MRAFAEIHDMRLLEFPGNTQSPCFALGLGPFLTLKPVTALPATRFSIDPNNACFQVRSLGQGAHHLVSPCRRQAIGDSPVLATETEFSRFRTACISRVLRQYEVLEG